jgi:hypothetical protein
VSKHGFWLLALVVLAACGDEGLRRAGGPLRVCSDKDNDGFDDCFDCDDGNPFVKPGAQEICNGDDDDCDGVPDDNCAQASHAALFHSLSSGGSYGASAQTNANHKNVGILGEPTPPNADNTVQQSNANHIHLGGFNAVLRR